MRITQQMIATFGEYNPNARNIRAGLEAVFAETPTVVTLCGSTRFGQQFRDVAARETLRGKIVLAPGVFLNDGHVEKGDLPPVSDLSLKVALDELHKRKIDLSDEIIVLNIGGYIGESTRSEIAYAEGIGVPVLYEEGPF